MFGFDEPEVPHVSVETLKKAIDAHEDMVILDVRTEGEYSRGKIAGSINISVDRVACDVPTAIPEKTKRIYVYCLSGSRSVHAVDVMRKLGYTNVYDVEHGLMAWRVFKYPVEM